MAARAKGGTSALDVTVSASTRPLASSSDTRSTRAIGSIARAMIARASSSEIVSLNGRIFEGIASFKSFAHALSVWVGALMLKVPSRAAIDVYFESC